MAQTLKEFTHAQRVAATRARCPVCKLAPVIRAQIAAVTSDQLKSRDIHAWLVAEYRIKTVTVDDIRIHRTARHDAKKP